MLLKPCKLLALYGKFPVYLAPKPVLKTMYLDIVYIVCIVFFIVSFMYIYSYLSVLV